MYATKETMLASIIILAPFIMVIIGSIQLHAHHYQVNLPQGVCLFNGTTWMVDNSGTFGSMTNDALVFINGETRDIRAMYPAPPTALNLQEISTVTQKQAAWANAMVTCYVDFSKGEAYPEPIPLTIGLILVVIGSLVLGVLAFLLAKDQLEQCKFIRLE